MNDTAQTILAAAIRNHLADPQGKWSLNFETSNLVSAFVSTSGVPYFVAITVLAEHCMDHWANAIAEVYRLAGGSRVIGDTVLVQQTKFRDEHEPYAMGIRCKGALTALVQCYLEDSGRNGLYTTTYEGFLAFAHKRLTEDSTLLDEYGANLRGRLRSEIESTLSISQRDAIAREVTDEIERSRKAREEYLAREAVEKAKREKRAAAAAARKATRVGVAEYRAMVQPRADRETA